MTEWILVATPYPKEFNKIMRGLDEHGRAFRHAQTRLHALQLMRTGHYKWAVISWEFPDGDGGVLAREAARSKLGCVVMANKDSEVPERFSVMQRPIYRIGARFKCAFRAFKKPPQS